MQVKPREAAIIKTRKPSQPEKPATIIARKTNTARLNLLYLILVIFLEKNLANWIVKKRAIIPEKKIVIRIIIRLFREKVVRILLIATAEPVLGFWIE